MGETYLHHFELALRTLAGTFLASGTKSVVASLWSAEDTYAREFSWNVSTSILLKE